MATKKAAVKDELAVVSEVQRMVVGPGDVVVVRCEERIRPEFEVFLRKKLRRQFPNNEVIVISGGIELQILTEDPEA